MGLVMARKKDMSLGLQKLADTRSSIQTISLMYRRKVGIYPLLLETNLFRAATLPFKPCTSFIVFSEANFIMTWILTGLTLILLWDAMNPRNFSYHYPKHTLAWVQFHVIRLEGVKGLLKIVQVVILPYTLYQHVIHVNFHIPPNMMCEHFVHQPLIRSTCVLEPEWHHFVTEKALAGDEWSLLLV